MKNKDFRDLLESIRQARDIHAGRAKPSRVFKFDPVSVKEIRRKLHVSQTQFSLMIGVSVDTLQNWEQGRRRPEGPALVLLKIVEASPEIILKIMQEKPIKAGYNKLVKAGIREGQV